MPSLLGPGVHYKSLKTVNQSLQESCAIAKMTARCALFESKIAPLDPPSPKTSP